MTTRNQRDLDDLLADNGGELGALYQRLSKAQPPRRLDRQILAEASRAVHGRPKGARWLLGFGTAAGVLLAAGIAWRVNHDLVQQHDGAVLSAPVAAPAAPAAPIPMDKVIAVQTHEAPPSRPAGSPLISAKGFDDQEAQDDAAALAAPAAVDVVDESKLTRERSNARVAGAQSTGSRVQAAKPAARNEAEAFPAPAPPAAPAPVAEMAASQSDAVQAAATVANRASMAERASEPTEEALIRAKSEQAKAALPATKTSVETAIAQIRILLSEQRRDEATKALIELRRQHPDAALPDDLLALER